jgi:hypothetical protein
MFLELAGWGIEKVEQSKLEQRKMFGDSIPRVALRVSPLH